MRRPALALILLMFLAAAPAWAQEEKSAEPEPIQPPPQAKGFGLYGWGLRFGVGDTPDQIIGGAQWDFGDFKSIHLEPNVELGFGDDHVVLAGTFAVHYRFRHIERFRPYAGGGVGLSIDYFDPSGGNSDWDLDIGLRASGGFNWKLKSERQVFVELSFGFGYPYDGQIMAGWNF